MKRVKRDFDPEVWSRLPFWVREIINMVDKEKVDFTYRRRGHVPSAS